MKRIFAIVSVGIRQMLADPLYLLFALAVPLLLTWVMSYLPAGDGGYEMAILGVLVMFVGLNIITSAGGYIIDEKQSGTWQRILVSPTTYWQLMTGYFIKIFLLAWLQSLVLLLSSKYLFGAPWNQGYLSVGVVMTVYIFAMTGLALFIAGFVKSAGQVQMVAMAVVMIGTMLGGVFFPIENPSGLINLIGLFSPQGMVARALQEIFIGGGSVAALSVPLLWLGTSGLLLLTAGVLIIQREG